MKNQVLGYVFAVALAPCALSCAGGEGAQELSSCVVDADVALRPLQDEVCSSLEISNLTAANLDGLLPYTTAKAVRMYDNENLIDAANFLDAQADLFSLNVSNTPLQNELEIQSAEFDALSLEGTNVRNVTIASAAFGSLSLVNNPLESLTVGNILDLVLDGSDASNLDVFDGITTLNRLIVRNTSIGSVEIEAFADLQNEGVELIHCGNADDAACE